MSKPNAKVDYTQSARPVLSPRFVLSLLMIVGGIAWIVFYYVVVRPDLGAEPGGPEVFGKLIDLKGVNWNYVGGFGLFLLGLMAAAHPSTPLGRGNGVVVGMLGCFLLGLLWICTFYVVSNDPSKIPVMGDLGQYNLVFGIGLMAVGFAYATRWE